ncbi:hypothetical protein CPB83DRAFT_305204 [Crepidotus variabilis]|uniref:Uncharacterized protein n=1 Tax=Crepidotus variabilis TaxID=179855 RepID=A0A9P6EGI4_9AGAR|nr:hypothetical protein CPB83DRAFT_305204 [Crepidotus variabilis]
MSRVRTSVSVPSNLRFGVKTSNSNTSMSSTSGPSSGTTNRMDNNINAFQPNQQQPDKRVSFAPHAPTSATSSTTPPAISTSTSSAPLAKPPPPPTSNSNTTSSSSAIPKTVSSLNFKAESQESDDYGFDDDEFAAMAVEADLADLGQPIDGHTDLGQPIGDEDVGRPLDVEDVGRPIDMEEGTLVSLADGRESEDVGGVVGVHPKVRMMQQQQQSGERCGEQQQKRGGQGSNASSEPSASSSSRAAGTGLNRSLSRDEQIKAALNGPVKDGPVSGSSCTTSMRAASTSGSGSTSSNSTGSMRPPPPPGTGSGSSSNSRLLMGTSSLLSMTSSMAPPTSGSWAQTRHRQYLDKKQLQDQNVHPNQNPNPSGSGSMAARPVGEIAGGGGGGVNGHESVSKRSMGGGFNFPPGVNVPALTSTPIIGVKRPADALLSYSSSGLVGSNSNSKGRPGMGLHNQNLNQQTGGYSQQRQVLGSLEVGEGGDVKRVRR